MILGLLILCPQLSFHPETDAAETVSVGRAEAHEFMVRGDQARDRRQWAEAIRSYQAALEMFRMLGGEAPRWEQDYFNFRKEYCRREIRLIEQRTGRTADLWLEEEPSLGAADAQRYRLLYHTMRRENETLRQKVQELEEDLELMLEMEELERQREQTRRRQATREALELRLNESPLEEDLPPAQHAPEIISPPPPTPAATEEQGSRRRHRRDSGLRR